MKEEYPSKRRKTSSSAELFSGEEEQVDEGSSEKKVILKNGEENSPPHVISDLSSAMDCNTSIITEDTTLSDFRFEDDPDSISFNDIFDDSFNSDDLNLDNILGVSSEVNDIIDDSFNSSDLNLDHILGVSSEVNDNGCLDSEVLSLDGNFGKNNELLSVFENMFDDDDDNDLVLPDKVQESEKEVLLDCSNINSNGYGCEFNLKLDESSFINSSDFDILDCIDFSTDIDYKDNLISTHSEKDEGRELSLTPCTNSARIETNDSVLNSPDSKNSSSRGNGTWVSVGSDVVPQAQCFPDALIEFLLSLDDTRSNIRKTKATNGISIISRVRMHLSFLGWKIECRRDEKGNPTHEFRYISPSGKTEYSITDICKNLTRDTGQNSRIDSRDLLSHTGISDGSSSLNSKTKPLNYQRDEKPKKDLVLDDNNLCDIKPEYCPQAVIDWYDYKSEKEKQKLETGIAGKMTLKAKQHLIFVGWKLSRVIKPNLKRDVRYTSPKGKNYVSLVRACKAHLEDENLLGKAGQTEDTVTGEKSMRPSSGKKLSSAITCTMTKKVHGPEVVGLKRVLESPRSLTRDNLNLTA